VGYGPLLPRPRGPCPLTLLATVCTKVT